MDGRSRGSTNFAAAAIRVVDNGLIFLVQNEQIFFFDSFLLNPAWRNVNDSLFSISDADSSSGPTNPVLLK